MPTLAEYLDTAVDDSDPAAVAAYNEAVALINTTRAAIDGISTAADLPAAQALVAGEDVTELKPKPTPEVDPAVTPATGPAAMFGAPKPNL